MMRDMVKRENSSSDAINESKAPISLSSGDLTTNRQLEGVDTSLVENNRYNDVMFLLDDGLLRHCSRLTKGVYGRVYVAEWAETQIIIKRNAVPDPLEGIGSLKEIDILRRVEHPFIVSLDAVATDQIDIDCEDENTAKELDEDELDEDELDEDELDEDELGDYKDDTVSLIFEKADMTLNRFIVKFKLSFVIMRRIITQILLAVEYIHHHRVMHRDLKPDNILCKIPQIDGENRPEAVDIAICDFGMSEYWCRFEKLDLDVVTPYYRAPEIAPPRRYYDHKIDIWSVGCIVYEILTGKEFCKTTDSFKRLPRDKKAWLRHLESLQTPLVGLQIPIHNQEMGMVVDFLLNSLRKSAVTRFSASDLLALPLFAEEKTLIDNTHNKVFSGSVYRIPLQIKPNTLRDTFFGILSSMHASEQTREKPWYSDRLLLTAASIFDRVTSQIDVTSIDYTVEFVMAIIYIASKFHTEMYFPTPDDIIAGMRDNTLGGMLRYEMLIVSDILDFRITSPTLYDRIADETNPREYVKSILNVLASLQEGSYTVEELYKTYLEPTIEEHRTVRRTTRRSTHTTGKKR